LKTKTLSFRIDEKLMEKVRNSASEAGLTMSEYVVRVLKQPLSSTQISGLQKLMITRMTMDSPSYFMDKEYNITDVNLAATCVMGIRPTRLPMSADDLIALVGDRIVEYDTVIDNFRKNFIENPDPPKIDIETITFINDRFGKILTKKVGIEVDINELTGWVVTFNILSVENRKAFDEELLNQIETLVSHTGRL
jgi:hypothetical protein